MTSRTADVPGADAGSAVPVSAGTRRVLIANVVAPGRHRGDRRPGPPVDRIGLGCPTWPECPDGSLVPTAGKPRAPRASSSSATVCHPGPGRGGDRGTRGGPPTPTQTSSRLVYWPLFVLAGPGAGGARWGHRAGRPPPGRRRRPLPAVDGRDAAAVVLLNRSGKPATVLRHPRSAVSSGRWPGIFVVAVTVLLVLGHRRDRQWTPCRDEASPRFGFDVRRRAGSTQTW